jgi:hypothetical protein
MNNIFPYTELYSHPTLGIVVRANREESPRPENDRVWGSGSFMQDYFRAKEEWQSRHEVFEWASDYHKYMTLGKMEDHFGGVDEMLSNIKEKLSTGIPCSHIDIREGKAYYKP